MKFKRVITILVWATIMVSIFSISLGNLNEEFLSSESNIEKDYPPHEEFEEPSKKDLRKISEDSTYLTLFYNYTMDFGTPPKNVIMNLNGTCKKSDSTRMVYKIVRPDNREIKLRDENLKQDGHIDFSINARRSEKCRENIYEFGKRFVEGPSQPTERIDVNKVIFGKANNKILSDAEILKGEYTIEVSIFAENLEMSYGDGKTELKIMSLPPAPVQDLSAEGSDEKVELNWNPPKDNGGSDIVRYEIYRADTNKGYHYVGNVSAGTTSYVDQGSNKNQLYEKVKQNQIYFYKVIPINLDTFDDGERCLGDRLYYSRWRSNTDPVMVCTSSEDKNEESTGSFRWTMDYSYLTEEYIENKMNDIEVSVNNITGGSVCMYDLKPKGKENGLKKFNYEGGYYSNGKADIRLDIDKDTGFKINAEVEESSIDFSGELFVNESQKGAESKQTVYGVEKHTFQCSGSVKMEYTYGYTFKSKTQQTKIDLKMDWNMNMSVNYDEPRLWFSKDNYEILYVSISDCNYTGNINGDIDLNMSYEGIYTNESQNIDEGIMKEIVGSTQCWGRDNAGWIGRIYSPILSNTRIGLYKILGDTVGVQKNNYKYIGGYVPSEKDTMWITTLTNNQQNRKMKDGIYTKQYLDPTTMPGLLSILEAGFIRTNMVGHEEMIETEMREQVRNEIEELASEFNESEKEAYKNKRIKQLRDQYYKEFITEPSWEIRDQQSSVDGTDPCYAIVPVIDVVGYFRSESVKKSEVDSFLKDKQQYTEQQLEGEEEPSVNTTALLIAFLAILIIILSATWYRYKN